MHGFHQQPEPQTAKIGISPELTSIGLFALFLSSISIAMNHSGDLSIPIYLGLITAATLTRLAVRVGSSLSILLITVASFSPEIHLPLLIFFLPAPAVLLSRFGTAIDSFILMPLIWLSYVGLDLWHDFENNWYPALLVGLLTFAAWIVGNQLKSRDHERQLQRSREQALLEQIEATIHNRICGRLTNVVGILETNRRGPECVLTPSDIDYSVESIRSVLTDLRQLMDEPQPVTKRSPTQIWITHIIEPAFLPLISNRFAISACDFQDFRLPADQHPIWNNVLQELATNIVKYGDNREPIVLTSQSAPMALSISNWILPTTLKENSSQRGLSSSRTMLEKIGWTLETNCNNSRWNVTLQKTVKP